jgi:saccharopine dehydrogenase-like NADP-dependent oxidoreductase
MSFIDTYGIHETDTMLRGTFRNLGWCGTLKKIADIGLLSLDEQIFGGMTFADMMYNLIDDREADLPDAVSNAIGLESDDPVISRFEWLGLFNNQQIPNGINTHLDVLCNLFEQKLQYVPGERDMIVMHHEFIAEYPDRKEKITSTMIDFGIPNGDSSMSRTVALPVAIASKMILDESMNLIGVHRPVMPEVYEPILKELENLDIKLEERVTPI